MITGSKDNNVRFHLWQPDELVTEACSRVPRNLSKAEWDQHFSNQPYRKTCPDLPEEQQSTISEKDQAIAEIESSTLCTSDEKIIFSCNTTKNQVVSLCSSSHLTETVEYLQYRFGNVGKIPEMSYPVTREHPNKYFESGTMMYSGGGGAYLKFKNKEYSYSVFTATGSSGGGVLVNKLATQVEYLQCQGSTTSEIGPELFEKINIRKDPNELDFIIP